MGTGPLGTTTEPALMEQSIIPWAQRHRIGAVGAYWKTVWLASFRPRQLADAVHEPVSYSDAQRFRWTTVAWAAAISSAAAVLALGLSATSRPGARQEDFLNFTRSATLITVIGSNILFFSIASGIGSYFFHPRRIPISQQNRAVALSYYGCAPLAWLPLVSLLLLAGIWYQRLGGNLSTTTLHTAAAGLTLSFVFDFWKSIVTLYCKTTHPSRSRCILFGLLFPVIIAVIALACLAIALTIGLYPLIRASLSY